MENKLLEPLEPLDDADVQAVWPGAPLEAEVRNRLVDHAAILAEMQAVQDIFDANAVQLDDLARQRLLRGIERRPATRQSWPWRQAWVAAAATFLAVLGAGHWPGVTKDSARLQGGGDAQVHTHAARPVGPQVRQSMDPLDESSELAAALPGLEGSADGEEAIRDEGGDGDDLDAGLDALHGLAAEDSPEVETI